MTAPLVSVCIPAYKQVHLLRRTLASVAEQTFQAYEVIVSDDSPNDEVERLVTEFAEHHPHWRYVRNTPSLGSPVNWNKAVSLAIGEWVHVLHHDDRYHLPDSLERLMAASEGADMLVCATWVEHERSGIRRLHAPTEDAMSKCVQRPHLSLVANLFGPPSSVLFKRSSPVRFNAAHQYVVDFEFYHDQLRTGANCRYLREALIASTTDAAHTVTSESMNRDVELREYLALEQRWLPEFSSEERPDLRSKFKSLFLRYGVRKPGELKALVPDLHMDEVLTGALQDANEHVRKSGMQAMRNRARKALGALVGTPAIAPNVVVRLMGGLGNQMFQYAAGYAVAVKHGVPLLLDRSFLDARPVGMTWTPRQLELDALSVPLVFADAELIAQLRKPVTQRGRQRLHKVLPGIFTDHRFTERSEGFDARFDRSEPPVYLEGYWQNQGYFMDIAEELRRHLFLPKEAPSPTNAALARAIRSERTASVHVRRGDYVGLAAGFHGTCSPAYYKAAMERMVTEAQVEHFYLFSDEPEWVAQNLELRYPHTIVSHNTGLQSHWDLWLMKQCRHHIIANSSFSWWGAWLDPRSDKQVIAPARWFQGKDVPSSAILPPEWTAL